MEIKMAGRLNVTIALSDINTQGGAKLFFDNLIKHIPEYDWHFTQSLIPKNTDVLIYGNHHDFYKQAQQTGISTIIQRTQGQRALNLLQPEDLSAVICSSQKAYQASQHSKKIFICNGIDYDLVDSLTPIACDLLSAESRIGIGQKIETSIKWALKNNRKITVLGSKQHSTEATEKDLKRKYPNCIWVGLTDYPKSLAYIKGCSDLIVSSSAHGLSNSVLAATHFNKNIVNLGGVEIIDHVPDIKDTAKKYKKLILG